MSDVEVRRCFIDGNDGQIHLRVAGHASDKPAVICLHMVPKSGRSFAKVIPLLAKDRLVIAPDYPGYGESDPHSGPSHVTIDDYASAIWQVVDHFQLPLVNFVGYHTGSMVAVEATDRRPGSVERIINISAPIFTEQEVQELLDYFSPIPLDEKGERFRIMWERIMKYRGPGMTLEMAAVSMAENLRAGEDYECGHTAAFHYSACYAKKLAQLQHPLFVMNINDDLYQHSLRVDALLKNGYRKDFLDWGAGFLDAYPQSVAQQILGFLDDATFEADK